MGPLIPEQAVHLKNVYVRFGDIIILEDINFAVSEREIVSIVGPNGSGKTTLLKTMLGSVKPASGDVRIFGKAPSETRGEGLIGYLPQETDYNINFPVSAFDVVAMARYASRRFFERLSVEDRNIIDQSLDRVEILALRKKHFGSLSGGQKQRVLIARALAMRPKILMLDEPSTGLDAVAQDNFYALLKKLRDEDGLTIIMVSHDIGSVSAVVDKMACIKRKLFYHGPYDHCGGDGKFEEVFGKNVRFISHSNKEKTDGKSNG